MLWLTRGVQTMSDGWSPSATSVAFLSLRLVPALRNTRAECVKGGISLRMSTHMKRVLALDPLNQTVTVESGICGPGLEQALNRAPDLFGAPHRYTCGTFPSLSSILASGVGW